VKIAIPLADGRLAMHFGHCEHFALVDVYGVPSDTPETIVKAFLDGTIVSGNNLCDH